MNRLDRINSSATQNSPGCRVPTENAIPLLHEIRHAVTDLLDSGRESAIDLESLPMTTADEARLRQMLGQGEVQARLDALGKSTIQETAISGVWFVEHYNADDQLIGKYIEVSTVPSILKSQAEDIREGLQRLARLLAAESH